MLGSILTGTYRFARARWRALLSVALVGMFAQATVAFFMTTSIIGSEGEPTRTLVLLALAAQLAACWTSLAGVRVLLERDDPMDALGSGFVDAPKLLVGSWLLTILIIPALLLVSPLVLVAAIAVDRRTWGIRPALRHGVGQLLRNLGVYAAMVVVAGVLAALAVLLVGGSVLVTTGVPDSASIASQAALAALLEDIQLGLWLGTLLTALPVGIIAPSFVAATWLAFDSRDAAREWAGEDMIASTGHDELSPAVTALLASGTSAGAASAAAGGRRRMQVPPRAARVGRLPGPGVLSVANVALPPGASCRPVDASSLDLDVVDGAPGTGEGAAPAMWISSAPVDVSAAAWRQLAAGFAESGLWPLLVPEGSIDPDHEPWFEQHARRDRDAVAVTPLELLQPRLEASLRDTPLTDTAAFAASGLARGELARGSGRRTDALAATFEAIGPARLALVGARRPADAVHRLAWPGAGAAHIDGIELAEVLASWEERWGAILVGLTEHSLTWAVLRPPATIEEAVELGAEHHATCPDEADGWGDDRSYAGALLDAPTWQLSWT